MGTTFEAALKDKALPHVRRPPPRLPRFMTAATVSQLGFRSAMLRTLRPDTTYIGYFIQITDTLRAKFRHEWDHPDEQYIPSYMEDQYRVVGEPSCACTGSRTTLPGKIRHQVPSGRIQTRWNT